MIVSLIRLFKGRLGLTCLSKIMEEKLAQLPWILGGHMMGSQRDQRLEPVGPRGHCKDMASNLNAMGASS